MTLDVLYLVSIVTCIYFVLPDQSYCQTGNVAPKWKVAFSTPTTQPLCQASSHQSTANIIQVSRFRSKSPPSRCMFVASQPSAGQVACGEIEAWLIASGWAIATSQRNGISYATSMDCLIGHFSMAQSTNNSSYLFIVAAVINLQYKASIQLLSLP